MQIEYKKLLIMENLLKDGEWLALQSDRKSSFFQELANAMNLTQRDWSDFWGVINLLRQ